MKDLNRIMEMTMNQAYIQKNEIPDIDLYVDQIITLLEGRLGQNKRNAADKVITKTMINNYSKDGLLKRIKGKKYSKEHILIILMICGLKQGLAVQDIARILIGVDERLSQPDGRYDSEVVDEIYLAWGETGNRVSATLPDYVNGLMKELSAASGKDDPLPTLMVLTEISALCRRTAESIIDECFPEKQK